jgi:SAM-dependent methyltransferase
MLLKMFDPATAAGGSSTFWDENWDALGEGACFRNNDAVCENQQMFPLLHEKARPERLFLEGGCGPGQWVKYFHDRGYRALGIDFAPRTVERARRIAPELDIRLGSVLDLPLRDGEAHVYYSGGVVEHFEEGPERALAEARRVLAPDGWFLCSVPDASLLRRKLLHPASRAAAAVLEGGRVVSHVEAPAVATPPPGRVFFQYCFPEADFRARLERAGFMVERTFAFSLFWGLLEIPAVDRAAGAGRTALQWIRERRSGPKRESEVAAERGSSAPTPVAARGARGLFKRAFVREDRTAPLVGPLVGAAVELAGNMRMYVARPRVGASA